MYKILDIYLSKVLLCKVNQEILSVKTIDDELIYIPTDDRIISLDTINLEPTK